MIPYRPLTSIPTQFSLEKTSFTIELSEEEYQAFKKKRPDCIGSNTPDDTPDKRYKVTFEGASHCLLAISTCLEMFDNNDADFRVWSSDGEQLIKKIQDDAAAGKPHLNHASINDSQEHLGDIPLESAEDAEDAEDAEQKDQESAHLNLIQQEQDPMSTFSEPMFRKNKSLLSIQNNLISIAKKLKCPEAKLTPVDSKQYSENVINYNIALMDRNNQLYQLIAREFHERCGKYNEDAKKCELTQMTLDYLHELFPNTYEEVQASYRNVMSPTGVPSIEQKHSDQEPDESQIKAALAKVVDSEANYAYHGQEEVEHEPYQLSEKYVTSLEGKIDKFIADEEHCRKKLARIEPFYKYLMRKVNIMTNALKRMLGKSSISEQLSEGCESKAERLKKYAQKPSPLVDIIQDQALNESQKLQFLKKLAGSSTRSGDQSQKIKAIDAHGEHGSPLHYVVSEGSIEMLRLLLKHKPHLNSKAIWPGIKQISLCQVTPLHLAVALGAIEKVRLLLEAGADPNAVNFSGETPLHAVSDPRILQLLIQYRANVNAKDEHGQTPLHSAARHGNEEIVKGLLEQPNVMVDEQDERGHTALHLASSMNFEPTELLPWSGRSLGLFQTNREQLEQEEIAKRKRNLSIIAQLAPRSKVNKKNKLGYNVLHLAVLGPEMTQFNDHHLHNSLDYKHVFNKVQLLCQYGADVNATPAGGNASLLINQAERATPLLALYQFRNELPDYYHAPQMTDPSLSENQRSIAGHQFAQQKKDQLQKDRLKIARYLVDVKHASCPLDPKVMVRDHVGTTVLHQCLKDADIESFEFFVRNGMDPNYQYKKSSKTPFHDYFCYKTGVTTGWFENDGPRKMQALFDLGVNPNIKEEMNLYLRRSELDRYGPLAIAAILREDNLFSRHAAKMGVTLDDTTDLKTTFKQVFHDLTAGHSIYKDDFALSVETPMTLLEYSQTAEMFKHPPHPSALQMVQEWTPPAPDAAPQPQVPLR